MTHSAYHDVETGLDRLITQLKALGGLPRVEELLRRARQELSQAAATPPSSVAVVGASNDRAKYGNKAVRAFRKAGYRVYPVNPHSPRVEGLTTYPSVAELPVDRVDRLSVYVPPAVGLRVLEQLGDVQVGELWLNPGSESPELIARAEALGLNVVQACSILDVGEHPNRL